MNPVIFQTGKAAFKFSQKEVRYHLKRKKAEYASDSVFQLLKLISTESDAIFLSLDDNIYLGYVIMDLISTGLGSVTCRICGKAYDTLQLKQFAIGHGKNPFDIKQKQKGGYSLFGKRKNPSLFEGKGYKFPPVTI